MRVAIVVKEFPPDSIGGLQTQTKRMATALAESNEAPEVLLFTKRYGRHDDSALPFEVKRIPQLGVSPFISDLTFIMGCFFALLWHSRRIDYLQCMTIYPIGFLGLMVNRVTGIPYFAWIRGNDFYQMREVRWKRWMISQVLFDTRVLVQSPEIEDDVREYFPDIEPDIGVLGNGVDVPDDPTIPRENVVLFVGRLAPKKGVEYLIQAMTNVSQHAQLCIVGDGHERSNLESLAASLDVSVDFVGEVPPAEVREYYLRAGLLVLPSVEGEGMPNVVLEAMALGIPVVTTRSGGLPSVIDDEQTGFLVPMGDAESLAETIDRLLDDTELREQVGKNARSSIESERSWDAIVTNLCDEYSRLGNQTV